MTVLTTPQRGFSAQDHEAREFAIVTNRKVFALDYSDITDKLKLLYRKGQTGLVTIHYTCIELPFYYIDDLRAFLTDQYADAMISIDISPHDLYQIDIVFRFN